LIGVFVFIWVASAEVTQSTNNLLWLHIWGSLLWQSSCLVAVCKDRLCSLLEQSFLKKLYIDNLLLYEDSVLGVPLKLNDMHDHPEGALKDYSI
ncbi:hypothetical protein H5410_006408, partial [Solanum commersonii]